jgi:hypothetical protein
MHGQQNIKITLTLLLEEWDRACSWNLLLLYFKYGLWNSSKQWIILCVSRCQNMTESYEKIRFNQNHLQTDANERRAYITCE